MADVQEQIGFQVQGVISGDCAQRSLVHSLLLLGIPIAKSAAHLRTGVSRLSSTIRGTSENALIKGINRCNCIAYSYELTNAIETRKRIDNFLKDGEPVIISTEYGNHWMVVAGKESESKYFWIDSDDPELYGYDSWGEIRDWMEDEGGYYIIGVRPKDEGQLKHSLVSEFDKVYALFNDDELAHYWGVYLEDLTEILDSPEGTSEAITPQQFFSRYEKKIVDSLCYYSANTERSSVKWEVSNYQKVAIAHKMSLSGSREIQALIDIVAALSFEVL